MSTLQPSNPGANSAKTVFTAGVIVIIVVAVVGVIVLIGTAIFFYKYFKKHGFPSFNFHAQSLTPPFYTLPNSDIEMTTVEKFLNEIAREKPIRFSPQQLSGYTNNYSTILGSGGFGAVYKGVLPNGVLVAVKVLKGNLDKRVEEQFMAEIITIGRTYHINLVRLFGFCYDRSVQALVYEFMENGSLDKYLFDRNHRLETAKVHEIAIGTAKGLAYLHEECEQRIVHYDIKPANILLDAKFSPKVADFGLAKLCSRENTHVSMTVGRGTPGYAAPEMWMNNQVTHKCDVYSFGMLLFELLGRRRNFEERNSIDGEQWFPKWVWKKVEDGELEKVAEVCGGGGGGEEDKEKIERMCMAALWCVQYQPEGRPPMSKVVKMLEGEMVIYPPLNPFQHLMAPNLASNFWGESDMTSGSKSEEIVSLMKNSDQIEIAILR